MAPEVTHIVIGERVFADTPFLDPTPPVMGTFLLGCVLVDANAYNGIDRRQTHFVGRLAEDGEAAFEKSCENFLDQRDALLRCPWADLNQVERAFVAGYLCHLAADEVWKARGWVLWQELGLTTWRDFPLPPGVVMTASDAVSSQMYLDKSAVATALATAQIPDVLTHVPHAAFQHMWDIVHGHALDGSTPESYFKMRARQGWSDAELQATREQHEEYWDDALAFVRDVWGIEGYVHASVRRSAEVMPKLWESALDQTPKGKRNV